MAFDEIKSTVEVKEIMNSPVITVKEETNVTEIAKLMKEFKVGSVIVVDKKGNPLGIVTKTDVIEKVLSEKRNPNQVKAVEVMSSPLLTIAPNETVQNAAKIMRSRRISRLGVIYKKRLVGILSLRDIVRVTPELIDIVSEKTKIQPMKRSREKTVIAGYCESCGCWSDDLIEIDGKFYCKECRIDMFGER